jgi:hypothetical protein
MSFQVALRVVFTLLVWAVAPAAFADDQLYKCDDDTFTNRPERLCEPYQSKGLVIIAPEGTTFNTIRALIPRAESRATFPDPIAVCNLYKEWMALNLLTGGGVTFTNTQDVPRWMSLSRIFTAIGAPHCP